jgi:hypothetical protein
MEKKVLPVFQDLPELQWYSAKYCMIVPDAVVCWEKETDVEAPLIVPRMNEVAVPIPAMFALYVVVTGLRMLELT